MYSGAEWKNPRVAERPVFAPSSALLPWLDTQLSQGICICSVSKVEVHLLWTLPWPAPYPLHLQKLKSTVSCLGQLLLGICLVSPFPSNSFSVKVHNLPFSFGPVLSSHSAFACVLSLKLKSIFCSPSLTQYQVVVVHLSLILFYR